MKKKLFAVLTVLLVLSAFCVSAFADDIEVVTGENPISSDPSSRPVSPMDAEEAETAPTAPEQIVTKQDEVRAIQKLAYDQIYSQLPTVTSSDILNWATTKGNEVIYILQVIAQPFAIVIFIIAAFMTLIGCVGKSDMIGKGVLGMCLSLVVYAAILYAPVLLQAFSGWVAS